MRWQTRAALDAKVALVRAAGYPAMPWGRARRSGTELTLLVLAALILEDEESRQQVQAGVPIRVYSPERNQLVLTDADYWTAEIARRRAELAKACAAAVQPDPA